MCNICMPDSTGCLWVGTLWRSVVASCSTWSIFRGVCCFADIQTVRCFVSFSSCRFPKLIKKARMLHIVLFIIFINNQGLKNMSFRFTRSNILPGAPGSKNMFFVWNFWKIKKFCLTYVCSSYGWNVGKMVLMNNALKQFLCVEHRWSLLNRNTRTCMECWWFMADTICLDKISYAF